MRNIVLSTALSLVSSMAFLGFSQKIYTQNHTPPSLGSLEYTNWYVADLSSVPSLLNLTTASTSLDQKTEFNKLTSKTNKNYTTPQTASTKKAPTSLKSKTQAYKASGSGTSAPFNKGNTTVVTEQYILLA